MLFRLMPLPAPSGNPPFTRSSSQSNGQLNGCFRLASPVGSTDQVGTQSSGVEQFGDRVPLRCSAFSNPMHDTCRIGADEGSPLICSWCHFMATTFGPICIPIPSGAMWAPQFGKCHGKCSSNPFQIFQVLEMFGKLPTGLVDCQVGATCLAGWLILKSFFMVDNRYQLVSDFRCFVYPLERRSRSSPSPKRMDSRAISPNIRLPMISKPSFHDHAAARQSSDAACWIRANWTAALGSSL